MILFYVVIRSVSGRWCTRRGDCGGDRKIGGPGRELRWMEGLVWRGRQDTLLHSLRLNGLRLDGT